MTRPRRRIDAYGPYRDHRGDGCVIRLTGIGTVLAAVAAGTWWAS